MSFQKKSITAYDPIVEVSPLPPETPEQWRIFREGLQRELDRIHDLIRNVNNTSVDYSEEIDSIRQNLNQLNTTFQSLLQQFQINQNKAEDSSLLDALNSHMQSKTVHGISGEVVGTTDEQELDSKTIGLNEPSYGRFRALIGASAISATEKITIPTGYHMVVPGDYMIEGEMTIEGTLLVL